MILFYTGAGRWKDSADFYSLKNAHFYVKINFLTPIPWHKFIL
jgi:hypothetical protein